MIPYQKKPTEGISSFLMAVVVIPTIWAKVATKENRRSNGRRFKAVHDKNGS
jgi:hypothetical protein